MPELQLTAISKRYGSTLALHPTSLTVEKGEFVTVLGPSGCGKSTLLRILMGITEPSGGEIELAGKRIEALPPERRDIAMVFQSYALFPHMNVAGNLRFGLKMRRVPRAEQQRRIAHAVEICNLGGLVERMPRQLSGGQQQRVALARAIVMQPALMLFDEPLSNLDAQLRESLRHELIDLHRRTGATSLYVTHDQAEAMAMSDRVVVMDQGRVVEIGKPVELYRHPKHVFTAGFIGQTNLLQLVAYGRTVALPWGGSAAIDEDRWGAIRVSLRPENIALTPDDEGQGEILSAAFFGAQAHYVVGIAGEQLKVARAGGEPLLQARMRVALDLAGPVCVLQDETAEVAA